MAQGRMDRCEATLHSGRGGKPIQPRSHRPRIALVPLVIVVVAALAGCAAGPTYSDLDRAAEPSDVLPADLPSYASEDMKLDTVRFAGEASGVQFYLSQAIEAGSCLLIYRDAKEWGGGCGVDLTVGAREMTARVVPDGTELDAGWTSIGHNVQAIGLPE